jgi:hypothetical protein
MADTRQIRAILMCREAISIRPVDSGSRAAAVVVARARAPPELVHRESDGEVTYGIDRGAEVAMAILVHRIGTAGIGR